MGILKIAGKATGKVADSISKVAALSNAQLEEVAKKRDDYLLALPDPADDIARSTTEKLLAANGVEVFNAYLPQISKLYAPLEKDNFNAAFNVRYFNITKWVTDKKENSLEKLVNVYAVLSEENCNIALVFHRTCEDTQVYIAITNTQNDNNNKSADTYDTRLKDAIRGNFPGTKFSEKSGHGIPDFLDNDIPYSVASASNIPTEKSEKFISQTIEKLLDGVIPSKTKEEYTLILIATPIQDVEQRKLRLAEIYSGLKPYASWSTNYTFDQMDTFGSSATVGVNIGASAGIQNGQNSSVTNSTGTADTSSHTDTESVNDGTAENTAQTVSDASGENSMDTISSTVNQAEANTVSSNTSHTDSIGSSDSVGGGTFGTVSAQPLGMGATGGASVNYNHGWNSGTADMVGEGTAQTLTNGTAETTAKALGKSAVHTLADTVGKTTSHQVGKAVANTLGRTVTNTLAKTAGVISSTTFGVNVGMSFARSSNVSATVGKHEGITQSFENYNINHALELLEEQMKRLEQSTALGMWDFAAYVMSEDRNIANNVAHSYLALTEGENSYMSSSAINLWRGDIESQDIYAKTICSYLREFRHPVFGLNPEVINSKEGEEFQVYPAEVTATTSLSGRELAYSLNFPQKSIAGLPVIQCAEFGRSIASYDDSHLEGEKIKLGDIFHMLNKEKLPVQLTLNLLTSHTFITGSTGTGKSNTVYQILNETRKKQVKFLVIEPAKGEYKHVFGNDNDVNVYGTNPRLSLLLKINPFSFDEEVHILEHLDRLIEIFNVCWPMYAAMPAVLKKAVEQSYVDCGWNLTESVNPFGDNLYPTFRDVARNIKIIIDKSEYDAENKGAYKGSLLTRLESLSNGIYGMIFDQDEISEEELFDKNTIIDLSRVGSSETKSLIMGVLVLKQQEYRMAHVGMNLPLKHITVLEEAHNLLKRTSVEQPVEGGNLLGKSVEMISNAIAEMRTYGEGFIIADQAPGLLDISVIRNTNTKIIMRLPDKDDRELVGRAAGLDDDQITELAKLPCGVAAVYQNEWVQPVLCKVDEYKVSEKRFEYINTDTKENIDTKWNTDGEGVELQVAEFLSKGHAVEENVIFADIRARLQRLHIDASVEVAIIRMLMKPVRQPRMTNLGPIMSELFNEVYDAVKTAYAETSEKKEWTKAAETALANEIKVQVDQQVKRDIVQSIITQYLVNELNDSEALEDWSKKGGF
ncbi:helicase HerA domain-containing protein [Butyrivibrio fibrisolvens]|uniref:helicase HerA domain-containing protein n=1 Tax=Butyrivibrio fibrisolvens TaxID=831 RepID=UPI0003B3CE1C|nr:DUF87 domain-containing protein [Butyrivibrio fibrisolvens]